MLLGAVNQEDAVGSVGNVATLLQLLKLRAWVFVNIAAQLANEHDCDLKLLAQCLKAVSNATNLMHSVNLPRPHQLQVVKHNNLHSMLHHHALDVAYYHINLA